MSGYPEFEPLTDEQILEMDEDDAVRALMETQGMSEVEARQTYRRIAEAGRDFESPDTPA